MKQASVGQYFVKYFASELFGLQYFNDYWQKSSFMSSVFK